MNIAKDQTIYALNEILSHISRKKLEAMKAGNHDALDAYEDLFRFVVDNIYCNKVAEWKRKHPIRTMIMNIKHKRRLKRFRELTAEIRGILA